MPAPSAEGAVDVTMGALRGARAQKPRRWSLPEGRRVAFWLVMNLEAFDPGFPIDGGRVCPDYRELAVREYGNRVGLGRLIDCFDALDITPSAATNAAFVREWPDLGEAVIGRGWDIMGHGDFNNRKLVDYGEQEDVIISSVLSQLSSAKGSDVAGWLSPGLVESPSTLRYLTGHGVRYLADFVADDVPFEMTVEGRSIVSVPYSLTCNDKPACERYHLTPEEFSESVTGMIDQLSSEAAPESPRVACLALHPYVSGTTQRFAAVRRLLSQLRDRDDLWWCTGAEIADRYVGLG